MGREGVDGWEDQGGVKEGRKSSNERDIANLDLEVYKLISFFLREGKKKKKWVKERKKEEEKEGEWMEILLYSEKNGY